MFKTKTSLNKLLRLALVVSPFLLTGNSANAQLTMLGEIQFGGPNAYRLAMTTDGATALVTWPGNGSLVFIDVATRQIETILPIPGTTNIGMEIDVTSDGLSAVISTSGGRLTQIDLVTRSIVGTTHIPGTFTYAFCLMPQNTDIAFITSEDPCAGRHCMYIAEALVPGNWASGATILATVPVDIGPIRPAVSPDGRTVLVPSQNSGSVTVVEAPSPSQWNLASSVASLPVGGAQEMFILSDGVTALMPGGSLRILQAPGPNDWENAVAIGSIAQATGGSQGLAISQDERSVLMPGRAGSGVDLFDAPSGADWEIGCHRASISSSLLSGDAWRARFALNDSVAVVTRRLAGAVGFVGIEPPSGPVLGSRICSPAVPNSTNRPGRLVAWGSDQIGVGDFFIEASCIPTGQFGFFLGSLSPGFIQPATSQGPLCLGGNIGRFNSPLQVGTGPLIQLQVDLSDMPTNPHQPAVAGQTWYFSCWHRDAGSTSNFTDTVGVTFQ